MACLFKRNNIYYLYYFEGTKRKKVSLQTNVYNIALEKKRQLEPAMAQGKESPLPTKTPTASIISRYIQNMRAKKTAKSAQTDTYYLRKYLRPDLPGTGKQQQENAAEKTWQAEKATRTIW